jgi:hypothetical protein
MHRREVSGFLIALRFNSHSFVCIQQKCLIAHLCAVLAAAEHAAAAVTHAAPGAATATAAVAAPVAVQRRDLNDRAH